MSAMIDVASRRFNAASALGEDGRWDERIAAAKGLLLDHTISTYLRTKSLLLLASATDDWNLAEVRETMSAVINHSQPYDRTVTPKRSTLAERSSLISCGSKPRDRQVSCRGSPFSRRIECITSRTSTIEP